MARTPFFCYNEGKTHSMPRFARRHSSQAPTVSSSLRWRMIMQALILTAFVIVVLTTLSFVISRVMLERAVRTQIATLATIAENSLENTLQSHRERASLLADNGEIRAVIAGSADALALERMLAIIQRDQPSLVAMEMFDARGETLAAAGDAIGLPREARRMPFHRPVITEAGWTYYDAFTPVWGEGGERLGYLALRYHIQPALEPLLGAVPALGDTAEAVLTWRSEGALSIIHPSLDPDDSYVLTPGDLPRDSVILRAMSGTEAVTRTDDYRGRDVLVAYRYLPTLGWGMLIQVERMAALQDVRRLAVAHAAIGTLLLILAGSLAFILANQVTQPLRRLTDRVSRLRPGAWGIKRSVFTDDEVEVLDQVVVDMATRLRQVYDKQEEIIDRRTKELREQYALDRAILESIEYGVITVDRDGAVTGGNPAAAILLMENVADIKGKKVEDVMRICGHRGDPLEGAHPVRECIRTGTPQRSPVNAHFNVRRSDDALLPVMYTVSPLLVQGKVFGAIIIFQDITEERRLDYLKSEFISLASHQLRTPLSALRWYVELFGEDKKHLNADQKGYLKEMQTSIERMVALLTSLLHAAHFEGDNFEPEVQEVNLSQMLRDVSEDAKPLVHEHGLSCKLIAPEKKVMLHTDPTLLRIVLQNLVGNAAKYTPRNTKKPIVLELSETPTSVMLSVQDEGMGIPAAEQSRVFQKFFRAHNVRKQDTDGNGLGLYITRSIVERLGGAIRFTSEEDKGSTFTVVFPKGKKAVKKKK